MIKRDDVTTLLAILALFFISPPWYIIFTTAGGIFFLVVTIVYYIDKKNFYSKFSYLSPSKKNPDIIAKQFKKAIKNKKNRFSIFNSVITIILLLFIASIYNIPSGLWHKPILLGLFMGALASIAYVIMIFMDKTSK